MLWSQKERPPRWTWEPPMTKRRIAAAIIALATLAGLGAVTASAASASTTASAPTSFYHA